jgi:hypothetical protein
MFRISLSERLEHRHISDNGFAVSVVAAVPALSESFARAFFRLFFLLLVFNKRPFRVVRADRRINFKPA